MGYQLTCDSCGFDGAVEEEHSAYTNARDHEANHPEHFVYIVEADRE